MQVLPVIDLKHGRVVRGVAGQRDAYRPVRSCLCESAAPNDVARALAQQLNCDEAYVADLDAIEGAGPDENSLSAIAAAGLRLWVDAGIRTAQDAEVLAGHRLESTDRIIDRLIVGLESVAGPSELEAMVDRIDAGRLVFSLDLKGGRPLACWPQWRTAKPIDIVRQVRELGIRQIIVLDLAQVGTGEGVSTLPLCRQITAEAPDVQIITGGGVATRNDLTILAEVGVDAALVASALHDGRIGRSDMEEVAAL
jgi:phosphoribosylformimino-5-aminoimidazole carboxamide ribotide isomerase